MDEQIFEHIKELTLDSARREALHSHDEYHPTHSPVSPLGVHKGQLSLFLGVDWL